MREYGGIPPFAETVQFVADVINRQLGLPDPKRHAGATETALAPIDSNRSTGSATPTRPRQWVGGVMHF
ncbi:hypothetical protein [Mesorhizobium sp. B1-1-8]|uniref:hypothetical protein n=1 Tax=Mesorhizobium sp. B1-1-8 TaxID=2589976 RepID=UPI001D00B798|nr:hypothetical protein [Mesorhizobium sp. B1-1-8]UCI10726.1 hypothetical protein FJ974_28600 [Mesorhizobium sp. B1-1-8]